MKSTANNEEAKVTIASDLLQRHIQTLVDDNPQWQTLIILLSQPLPAVAQAPSLVAAAVGTADIVISEQPWLMRGLGGYVFGNPGWDFAAQYRQASEGHVDLKVGNLLIEVKSAIAPERIALQALEQAEPVRNFMVELGSTPIWNSVDTAEENRQHA